jgi:hypothetical protein
VKKFSSPFGLISRAPEIRLKLIDGVSFIQIGDKKALFSSNLQKIFELNNVAAFIASSIASNMPTALIVRALEANGMESSYALKAMTQFIVSMSKANLLSAEISKIPQSYYEESLEVAGKYLVIRYHDAALVKRVAPVFEHLRRPSKGKAIFFDLMSVDSVVYIFRNGVRSMMVKPHQAAPVLKGMITEAIFQFGKFSLALHSALLIHDGHALLLVGSPGAGKTTLTMALLNNQFEYAGDDIALLMNDGLVMGLPFSLSLKSGAWKLGKQFNIELTGSTIHRRIDGKKVRYVRPNKLTTNVKLPVKWIVSLHRESSGKAWFEPMSVAEMLQEFVDGAFSSDEKLSKEQLRLLVKMIGSTTPVRLHYSSAGLAAKILQKKCKNE